MNGINQPIRSDDATNLSSQPVYQEIESSEETVSLLDMLDVLVRHRKQLLVIPIVAALLGIVVSLVLPAVYKGTAKLLPPQQSQSGASALLAQLGGAAGLAGVPGIKNQSDLYIGMLKSRTVADKLVEKFDLMKRYDTDSRERARAQLEAATTITSGKDGLLTIEVEDRNQKLVAKITNAYIDELLNLTKVLATTGAAQSRLFYERQLYLAKDGLVKAEIALKSALDSNGVISVDAETRTILETSARLRAQVSAKEIQLASLKAFVTAENPEYKRAAAELENSRIELARLENGRMTDASQSGPASKQRSFDNIQLMRELKYRQMLYETLAKQFEIARLEEAKDPSVVQVLDAAVEPEYRSKPKRAIIVLVSAFAGLLLAIAWAFASDAFQRAVSTPDEAKRWAGLKKQMFSLRSPKNS